MKIMPRLTSSLYCKMQFAGAILLPRCEALWGEFPIFCTNVIPGILFVFFFFPAQESWVTASTRKTHGQPWMIWIMTRQGDWETCDFAAKFSHFPPASFSMFFCRLLKNEKMMMIQISWSIFSPAKCEELARARGVIVKVTAVDGGAPRAHPALASLPTTSRDTAAGVSSYLCCSWRHRGTMWSLNRGPLSWIVPESTLSLTG